MADFVSTPTTEILWSIRNYSTSGVKSYTSSCFGLHWKFEFVPYLSDNKNFISIFLECVNVSENLLNMKCSFNICILRDDGSKHPYGAMTTEITLKDKRWIIWWNAISSLNLPGPDICWCIKISLCGGIEKQIAFREEIRKHAKEEKDVCLTSLLEDIASLYDNCDHSDFELRCKERTIPVHKAVLSARCGYFAALFRSHMKETDKGYVEFHDIKPDILQHVIHYLYTGKLPELDLDSVREVYAVADRFDFGSLKVKCASLAMDNFVKDYQSKTKSYDINQEVENLHESDQPNINNDSLSQEAGKLNESNQSNTKNDTSSQDTVNLHDSHEDKSKTLLKQLFRTSEWIVLFDEYPALAEKMCKPIILDVPKI